MKTLLVLSVILTILLTGCSVFNLSDFVLPNDIEFLQLVESLKTPKEICQYMLDNFEYRFYPFKLLSPYELFLYKKGDCNDFASFATFIANYHGYETYQIKIFFSDTLVRHRLAIYIENDKYTFSSNQGYYPWLCDSFTDVINCYTNDYKSYEVYDYNNNLIEKVQN